MKTVGACNIGNWQKVCSHVNRAVLFIDNVCAELLHWQGGLLQLIKAGATDVKEFSSFESGGPGQKKGVFLISSVLEGVAREILQDILQASHFQYVVLITTHNTAVHTFSHHGTAEDNPDFFGQVEERLTEWMGNMNYTAEVFHIPLFTASIDNFVFITPGYTGLFPLVDSDLHQLELQYSNRHQKSEDRNFDSLKSLELASLPRELQVLYKCFVSSVDSLLTDLGVKEDIYSVGFTSSLLAAELEAFPLARNRRKTLSNRASVVFVDRTLDLAGVTCHNAETLMDRIVQVLPRLPNHVIDVGVNMAPLCKVHSETGSKNVLPGCLASQTGTHSHLHGLVTSKIKDGLMDVNRRLVEAAAECSLPVSLKGKPTRVTAEQLDSTLHLFKGKYQEISAHLDAVQVGMATASALKHPTIQHCDEMIGVEKGLLQCVADTSGTSALYQVCQMIEKKTEAGSKSFYTLDDVLSTLVYLYSLAGQDLLDTADEEIKLQKALADRILEEKEDLPPLTKAIIGDAVGDRTMVLDILEDMWGRLLAIAGARQHLSQFKQDKHMPNRSYRQTVQTLIRQLLQELSGLGLHYLQKALKVVCKRSVLDPGSAVSPATHNSLCKQIMEAIFDPEKREITDIEFRSSGLKDMLKSGFGLFRSVAKPRPSDHPLLLLFIVGGITTTEVKQVREIVNLYKPSTEVIIGSTKLLTPADAVKSVLSQNNVNPEGLM